MKENATEIVIMKKGREDAIERIFNIQYEKRKKKENDAVENKSSQKVMRLNNQERR